MFLIWGTRGLTEVIDDGDFNCPVCAVVTKYELKEVRRWFTFFWIPLIPLRKKVRYLECQQCFTAFNPEFFQKTDSKMSE